MQSLCLLMFAVFGSSGHEQVIDAFSYTDAQAARNVWVPGKETMPVRVVQDIRRPVLEFLAAFATDRQLQRTIHDRRIALDLAATGEFTLDLTASDPEGISQVTLYFRSGTGWFGSGQNVTQAGWQTLRFPKSSFRVENKPIGWHKIDGVRISVWRGQDKNTVVRLGRLAAHWHDLALIVPAVGDQHNNNELKSARQTSAEFAAMLSELGVKADSVDDVELIHGALGQRPVAVLAYHPHLDEQATEILVRFIQDGGKLFACYSIPQRLARALGIARLHYFKPDPPARLAEVRFDDTEIPGLPKSVRQASWNITVPEPGSPSARIIGWWYDADGHSTGQAAMLVSDTGAYFSHIVLSDDRDGKKQLLAAILGRLYAPLWPQMARAEFERLGRVGHIETVAALSKYVQASGRMEAQRQLQAALQSQRIAQDQFVRHAYPECVVQARQTHARFLDAYLRAVPSRPVEGRAFWNHSGTGAYPGDWERTATELAEAGFNMVLANLIWAGRAHFPSNVLPRSKTYDEFGDQIAQCVTAAHRHGLEVHVWKVNYNLSGADKSFVKGLRRDGRLQVSHTGESYDWLCPSHPENIQLELDSLLEVVRTYDVDGIHFDYIRYPNADHCYCSGCRQRFEADAGVSVVHWPADCYSGVLRERYRDWRCQQITRLVAAVHDGVKKIKPNVRISAAVFGAYPKCRETVGQDWVAWCRAGYLDFVCPMDYTQSDQAFAALVKAQLASVGGRVPVYPGIGAWHLTPDRTVGQIHVARSLGASGFTLFNLTEEAATSLLPAIALGANSQRAIPPHRRR